MHIVLIKVNDIPLFYAICYQIPVAWFLQPQYMPDWLYQYFGDVIQPLILTKDGSKLAQPATFMEAKPYAPASFWTHPPEATFGHSHHHFDPHLFYHPHVFCGFLIFSLKLSNTHLTEEFLKKWCPCSLLHH